MLPTPDEPRLEPTGVPNSPVATPPLGEETGRAGPRALGNSVEPSPPPVLSYFNARDRTGRCVWPYTLAGMASVACMAQFLAQVLVMVHGNHYDYLQNTKLPDFIIVILKLLVTAILLSLLVHIAVRSRRLRSQSDRRSAPACKQQTTDSY